MPNKTKTSKVAVIVEGKPYMIPVRNLGGAIAGGAQPGVQMISPDGKKYFVPLANQDTAQKNGWKWDDTPSNRLIPNLPDHWRGTVPYWSDPQKAIAFDQNIDPAEMQQFVKSEESQNKKDVPKALGAAAMAGATPALVPALAESPVATAVTLAGSAAGGKGAKYLTKKAGGGETAQNWAELGGSLAGGVGTGLIAGPHTADIDWGDIYKRVPFRPKTEEELIDERANKIIQGAKARQAARAKAPGLFPAPKEEPATAGTGAQRPGEGRLILSPEEAATESRQRAQIENEARARGMMNAAGQRPGKAPRFALPSQQVAAPTELISPEEFQRIQGIARQPITTRAASRPPSFRQGEGTSVAFMEQEAPRTNPSQEAANRAFEGARIANIAGPQSVPGGGFFSLFDKPEVGGPPGVRIPSPEEVAAARRIQEQQ